MSFYRKYRPQIMSELDNPVIRERLVDLLSKKKEDLPHAYLFTGAKGSGKTTTARIIAKFFNCTDFSDKSGPCGKCDQCLSIAKGNNLDVIEMDAASNRGIDEIRSLRESVGTSTIAAKYKIYIIDEVHMLTTEAFNALLKTLEEPPAHAIFILATTDPQKVPATIKSRCQILNFGKADQESLLHALQRIIKQEKIEIDADALNLVIVASDGSFRDGVKILEQLSLHKGKLTGDLARSILALSDDTKTEKMLENLASHNAGASLKLLAEINKEGSDLKTFLVSLLEKLEKILVAVALGEKQQLWQKENILRAIEILSNAYNQLKFSPIPALPLEMAIVQYCQSDETVSETTPPPSSPPEPSISGLLTSDKLVEHWQDLIAALKPFNHSVAAVLRSARPKVVENGIVTIEAFYKFHQEKLAEVKVKEAIADTLKKLFGEKVKVEIVLGKK